MSLARELLFPPERRTGERRTIFPPESSWATRAAQGARVRVELVWVDGQYAIVVDAAAAERLLREDEQYAAFLRQRNQTITPAREELDRALRRRLAWHRLAPTIAAPGNQGSVVGNRAASSPGVTASELGQLLGLRPRQARNVAKTIPGSTQLPRGDWLVPVAGAIEEKERRDANGSARHGQGRGDRRAGAPHRGRS